MRRIRHDLLNLVPSVRQVVDTVTKSLAQEYDFPADIVELCEDEVSAHVPQHVWGPPRDDFIDCITNVLEQQKIRKHA